MPRLTLSRCALYCAVSYGTMIGHGVALAAPKEVSRAANPPRLEARLDALATKVEEQQSQIDAQQAQILADRHEIEQLKEQVATAARQAAQAAARPANAPTTVAQAASSAPPSVAPSPQPGAPSAQPEEPVGQSPDRRTEIAVQAQAVPQGQGVLTPAGKTTVQLSYNYIRSSNDRLVFSGIELVPGLQIGVIEASRVQRNTHIGSLTVWHGFTDRLEAEVMVPVMSRDDQIKLSQVRNGTVSEGFALSKTHIGDIEGAVRWQVNAPIKSDVPIWVLSLRVKSNSGVSPFSVPYDQFGVATGLATGSGFWGIQPGVTFLLPSDPVVIYGGASLLHQFPRDINRTVNAILIGKVSPGDALAGNVGFGFALNPRFSFSLGYSHTYVWPTEQELDATTQRSTGLTIGTLDMGMSYRLSSQSLVNFAFQFGVTQDAPDLSVALRVPFTF